MLDSIKVNLKLPRYETLKAFEGKGNYAIRKYYLWPFSIFYRHKLKMIVEMIGDEYYHNILDFGSGPGVFTEELRKHALFVSSYDVNYPKPKWTYDVVVCASVLEFCELDTTINLLSKLVRPGGTLIIASPMKSKWTDLYFKIIGDTKIRHNQDSIAQAVNKHFQIVDYKTWFGFYFSLKGRLR